MPKTIYDKSTRVLLKDMLVDIGLQPGQVITKARAVDWFAQRYPKLAASSIGDHLVQASTNDRNRLHHRSTSASDDLLFRVGRGEYRLYEPGKDPTPIHERFEGDVAIQEEVEAANHFEADAEFYEQYAGSSEFLLEKDLQNYLAKNLDTIEPGLKLYEYEGVKGVEFEAGNGRRIDILAVDKEGSLVVLELKVSKGYDRVVGQLLRYLNWVRMNVADPSQKVRGMIVCRTMSEDLQLACAGMSDVELFEYQLSVSVTKIAATELP
jgi:hypothetical protein